MQRLPQISPVDAFTSLPSRTLQGGAGTHAVTTESTRLRNFIYLP